MNPKEKFVIHSTKAIVRLALIAVAAASLAACATRKAPPPPAPTPAPAPAPEPAPPPAPAPPAPVVPTGPAPGSVQDFVVNVGERVFFDYDSHALRAEGSAMLDAQAAWLARYPNVKVRIEGNADERGTREYNFALGARRANSVRDLLVSKGVAGSRIETVSYGKEKPIDGGTNEEAWGKNRNAHTALTDGAPQ
jgi:peptidoglycan-associated lipoprotein